jgi:hypothetical protein
MPKLSKAAQQTIAHIRATLPTVTDADVFTSPGGDALIWTDETIIHVDTNGATQEARTEFETGWEA